MPPPLPELRPLPFLDRHDHNLPALALRDELVSAIGRRAEMLQVVRTLELDASRLQVPRRL